MRESRHHKSSRTPRPSKACGGVLLALTAWLILTANADAEPPAAEQAIAGGAAGAVCEAKVSVTDAVARVIDGETLVLESGEHVRLIGALAPRAFDSGDVSKPWPVASEAKALLETLVKGRVVQVARIAPQPDRYGRTLANVFVSEAQATLWVQGEMLKAGLARAYTLPGASLCTHELLAHERAAREAKRGLWALLTYAPKSAGGAAKLMASRSRFEIVTGKVAAVARTRSAVYLNFGADFKTDFTVRIARSVLGTSPELAKSLDDLKDRTVSVRGWIERRNGPMIDVFGPGQIEILDSAGTAPQAGAAPAPAQKESPGPLSKRPGVDL